MRRKKDYVTTRRHTIYTDQHGRKWAALSDNDTRHPVSPITPEFTAPYIPESKYFTFAENDSSFVINYDAAIQDLKEADRTWRDAASMFVFATYGDKAAEVLDNPTPAVMQFTGPRPMSYQIPDAAKSGNKWMLGFAKKMPDWAKPLFPAVATRDAQPASTYPDAA